MNENCVQAWAPGFRYVVLAKEGRFQILVQPTARQLSKRARQGWDLLKAIDHRPDAWQVLLGTLQRVIPGRDAGSGTAAPSSNGYHAPRMFSRDVLAQSELEGWCDGTVD